MVGGNVFVVGSNLEDLAGFGGCFRPQQSMGLAYYCRSIGMIYKLYKMSLGFVYQHPPTGHQLKPVRALPNPPKETCWRVLVGIYSIHGLLGKCLSM